MQVYVQILDLVGAENIFSEWIAKLTDNATGTLPDGKKLTRVCLRQSKHSFIPASALRVGLGRQYRTCIFGFRNGLKSHTVSADFECHICFCTTQPMLIYDYANSRKIGVHPNKTEIYWPLASNYTYVGKKMSSFTFEEPRQFIDKCYKSQHMYIIKNMIFFLMMTRRWYM